MPKPRQDGTPAQAPNKRKLTDAFIKTVRPGADRVVIWDTLQRGLVLSVQPTGHRAWKCIYTFRGRGSRWFHIGDARAITLADARKLAGRVMLQVAEGKDPHADRLAFRGRGSFAEMAARYVTEHASKKNKSWRSTNALVARYLIPRWAKLDIGDIRKADVRAMLSAIERPVLANQILATASAIFSWAVRQEIITVNPCVGIERNDTMSRERIFSDFEIARFWPHLSAPLKMILLTGQRPGEIAHFHRDHVLDSGWWDMPGGPAPKTGWPGTKNGQSHRVWLSEPVRDLLEDVLGSHPRTDRMQREMRNLCVKLDMKEKVTPHDLRRTFCSKVTGLGFGREAMNRVTNHKEGGIADVYDRHKYAQENQKIMETVARHIVTIVEHGGAANVVTFAR